MTKLMCRSSTLGSAKCDDGHTAFDTVAKKSVFKGLNYTISTAVRTNALMMRS